jgi:alkylhydroperoxidase family enzyme
MPILSQVPLADVEDALVQERYTKMFGAGREPAEAGGAAGGTRGDFWTVLANSPSSFEVLEASLRLMTRDDVTPRVYKELGIVRASWNIGSQFTFSQHSKILRAQGVDKEKADAIRHWQTSPRYTDPVERLVLAYADDLSLGNGRVPDERMVALREHLTDPQIVEITYCVCLWVLHSTVARALRLEWDDRDDPVVEIPS